MLDLTWWTWHGYVTQLKQQRVKRWYYEYFAAHYHSGCVPKFVNEVHNNSFTNFKLAYDSFMWPISCYKCFYLLTDLISWPTGCVASSAKRTMAGPLRLSIRLDPGHGHVINRCTWIYRRAGPTDDNNGAMAAVQDRARLNVNKTYLKTDQAHWLAVDVQRWRAMTAFAVDEFCLQHSLMS